jgi:hypothetical protein
MSTRNPFGPGPYDPPARASSPHNPALTAAGWLVAVVLVLFITGLFVIAYGQAQSAPACPAGMTWNTAYRLCVAI